VRQLVGGDHVAADLVDLGNRVRHLEVERVCAVDQALRVLRKLEDLAGVCALALEYRTAVVQRVGEHVDVGLAPRDELAVEPYKPVAIVEGGRLSHAFSPWTFAQSFAT